MRLAKSAAAGPLWLETDTHGLAAGTASSTGRPPRRDGRSTGDACVRPPRPVAPRRGEGGGVRGRRPFDAESVTDAPSVSHRNSCAPPARDAGGCPNGGT